MVDNGDISLEYKDILSHLLLVFVLSWTVFVRPEFQLTRLLIVFGINLVFCSGEKCVCLGLPNNNRLPQNGFVLKKLEF